MAIAIADLHMLEKKENEAAMVAGRAIRAEAAMGDPAKISAFGRIEENVHHTEAVSNAEKELTNEGVAERFEQLEKNEEVERLLSNLNER